MWDSGVEFFIRLNLKFHNICTQTLPFQIPPKTSCLPYSPFDADRISTSFPSANGYASFRIPACVCANKSESPGPPALALWPLESPRSNDSNVNDSIPFYIFKILRNRKRQ
ncbi:hypothetical protein SLE2022_324100 [Rubroshorea leprosula]